MQIEANRLFRKNHPEMEKPRLMKLTDVPSTYSKKIQIRHNGLDTIIEEDKSNVDVDINEELFKEYGTFGDIVELSRKQILEGFVRPKPKEGDYEKYSVTPIAPLPKRMEEFKVPLLKVHAIVGKPSLLIILNLKTLLKQLKKCLSVSLM